jgi:DNA end-binding protein Ku
VPEAKPKRAEPRVRPFWSGTLSFGLVSVPIELYPAQRSARVSMRLLDPSGAPLARRYYCPEDDREVSGDELVRGYQRDSGEYVVVTDEELEALDPKKSRDIDLRRFVDAKSLDPLYFERAYFLAPGAESTKAYRLLAETMQRGDRAGIATFVLRDKEYVIAIFAQGGLLRAQTLRFHDEVRDVDAVGLPRKHDAPRELVQRFQKAIQKGAEDDFAPEELVHESADRLRELAQAKHRRGEDVLEHAGAAEDEGASADVLDLMAVLKRSLQQSQSGTASSKPASRAKRTARATAKPKRAATRKSTADDLAVLDKPQLQARAARKHIRGRSEMNKEELVQALRKRA